VLLYSGSVFKAEDLDDFVAFINPVINQVVLVYQLPRRFFTLDPR
jgi:hypothetical protein